MTIAQLAEGIQFTVDASGHTTAVVVSPELWQRLMDALETAEDRALVDALRSRLVKGPASAGALRWADVSEEWR